MLNNRRLLIILLLGFSSGLPAALTSSTLQAWFTEAGVNLMAIGALSLISVPYVWKFLWAPVMDRFVPPWGGRRRGWIALTQLGLCIALIILANMNPSVSAKTMGLVALVIAFLSASQDIAYDAYRVDVLSAEERGLGAALTIFGYRMAMLVSGGLALIFADYLGWKFTYEFMAGLIALSMVATFLGPETSVQPPKSIKNAVIEPFKDLWHREGIVAILLFVICYKIGDALALSLMSNFLLKELGFSLTDVGFAYKTMGLLATILGAFLGGVLLTRMSLIKALLVFGIAQAFSNLTFMVLAILGKNYAFMAMSVFIENFCSGMSTAALLAFLMSLCHQQYSATQFALLTALFSLGRVFLGPVAAYMVLHMGWANFYFCSFIACFPGILLLLPISKRVKAHGPAEAVSY